MDIYEMWLAFFYPVPVGIYRLNMQQLYALNRTNVVVRWKFCIIDSIYSFVRSVVCYLILDGAVWLIIMCMLCLHWTNQLRSFKQPHWQTYFSATDFNLCVINNILHFAMETVVLQTCLGIIFMCAHVQTQMRRIQLQLQIYFHLFCNSYLVIFLNELKLFYRWEFMLFKFFFLRMQNLFFHLRNHLWS